MEKVAQNIAIDQVEESTTLVSFDNFVNNVVSLFVKLSDTSNFTREIKDKFLKIDTYMK